MSKRNHKVKHLSLSKDISFLDFIGIPTWNEENKDEELICEQNQELERLISQEEDYEKK